MISFIQFSVQVVKIDDELEVEAKKYSNKQIFIAPWSIDVGLLQVIYIAVLSFLVTLYDFIMFHYVFLSLVLLSKFLSGMLPHSSSYALLLTQNLVSTAI